MSQQDSKSASISPNSCGCLFVLMLVVGIISAGFYKGFVNTSPQKAKQSEAQSYVRSMNRGQQYSFAETNAFATSIDALGIGIKTETTNYKYSLRTTKNTAFNYGVSKKKILKSYVGGVFITPLNSQAANSTEKTQIILCIADKPATIKPAEPTYEKGKIACGKGTTESIR
jgi:type IV pilus assembly protein PilA